MSDLELQHLAKAADIATSWKDVFGKTHEVAPPTLRAVLRALDLPADTDAEIADSTARATLASDSLPPLITGVQGMIVNLPVPPGRYRLTLEDGRVFDGFTEQRDGGCTLPPILEAGYHDLILGDQTTSLAIAPRQCFTAPEAMRRSKGWGLAVQLYALRRTGDAGIGDFTSLANLAPKLASLGGQAIGISPVHAQFSADPDRFSPYAPSTRTALNVLHAAIDTINPELEALDLIDWPAASRFRLARFRELFAAAKNDAQEQTAFERFRQSQGARLHEHALFETLHAHFFAADASNWHWKSWPAEYREPTGKAVLAFAEQHADEVGFHTWLQFRADQGLAAAQASCRNAGMGIGIVSDLAVGTDSGGSQCWSRQQETLLGLSVGAPPDLLQRHGQNWGLTAFSPRGLRQNGFATYRDMLHTALAHAGGMRIDHAMGLNRLWVIPEGATGDEGAYLSYPEDDLLALIKLESHRHRAIVLAEDLGTVPEGFQDRLHDAGVDGMRVLWFERDKAGKFVPPQHWTPRAAAMTSTHDLPTVAGWWSGRDIDWRVQLGLSGETDDARTEREHDKGLLWEAFCTSGAAAGEMPAADDVASIADAACVHVGSSACELVMLPVEDALALIEQPNLPGTLHEHPNWQRRLPEPLFDKAAESRLALLDEARRK